MLEYNKNPFAVVLKWVHSFLLPAVGYDFAYWCLTTRNGNSCLKNMRRRAVPVSWVLLEWARMPAPSFCWSKTTLLCFAVEWERNQQQFVFLCLLSYAVMALLLLTVVTHHSEQCGRATVWWKWSWSVIALWIWWCNSFRWWQDQGRRLLIKFIGTGERTNKVAMQQLPDWKAMGKIIRFKDVSPQRNCKRVSSGYELASKRQ